MPIYNYICDDCLSNKSKELGRDLSTEEEIYFVFEARHSMNASPDEIKENTECPFCEGHNTKKTYYGQDITVFSRGVEWNEYMAKNRHALARDMALHQLENADPYAAHRPPGDKADVADKLRDGAKKPNSEKVFYSKNSKKK